MITAIKAIRIITENIRMEEFEFGQIKDKLVAKLLINFPMLLNKWIQNAKFIELSDTPWTPLDKDSSNSISLAKAITQIVNPPRAVYPGYPMGHPLGFPGQTLCHLQLLRILLKHLEEINAPCTLIELDLAESKGRSTNCFACGV